MQQREPLEMARLALQTTLDAGKTQAERNRLGQFATPEALASEIVRHSVQLLGVQEPIRFLDPAFGTGSFYSALLRAAPERVAGAVGYEVDPWYGNGAAMLWRDTPLRLHLEDFTRAQPPVDERLKANLLICNPPYVRHHHLSASDKHRLKGLAWRAAGVELSGLAGLYCYFLCLAHRWMAEGGLACWLIPSEFLDVNYGTAIKQYLLSCVTLLRIHRFDAASTQFTDAMVSSAVVWFMKSSPASDHGVLFTFGGGLARPSLQQSRPAKDLDPRRKWSAVSSREGNSAPGDRVLGTTLGDFFRIQRGVATGANEFFVLTAQQVDQYRLPSRFLTPILPSPRRLVGDEVLADDMGEPIVDERRYLLTCGLPEMTIQRDHPDLWTYLEKGRAAGIDQGYLCRHRSPWYSQEYRPAPPFLCTYMGRQVGERGPFRFILNHSRAIAANVYLLLYPKPWLDAALALRPSLSRSVWRELRAITPHILAGEGRVYGGGLHKLEPRELGQAPADRLAALIKEAGAPTAQQLALWPGS